MTETKCLNEHIVVPTVHIGISKVHSSTQNQYCFFSSTSFLYIVASVASLPLEVFIQRVSFCPETSASEISVVHVAASRVTVPVLQNMPPMHDDILS